MSQTIGFLMIASGLAVLIFLTLKLFFQPFIPQDLHVHAYFPSTEIILGIPILCGTIFSVGFGMYIFQFVLKGSLTNS